MSIVSDEQSPLYLTTNQNYVLTVIEKEEDGNQGRDHEDTPSLSKNIAQRLRKFQDKLEINNAAASGMMSFLFILATYDIYATNDASKLMWFIEMIVVLDLCLDWVLFAVLSENRLGYLL